MKRSGKILASLDDSSWVERDARFRVEWTRNQLNRMTSLTGTARERKERWDQAAGTLTFRNRVFLIGMGAQGTMLLFVLLRLMSREATFCVIDPRDVSERIRDIVGAAGADPARVEWRQKRVKAKSMRALLPLERGDLVLDCSIGVDTIELIKWVAERGAMMINSAIEDWLPDGWTPPENEFDESMIKMHSDLVASVAEYDTSRFGALVSMGCNPGNVSLWTKVAIDFLGDSFLSGRAREGTYAERARDLGVETIHVSEWDSQTSERPRRDGEYCNTWSTDSAAFYKEGMGPSEMGIGSHERLSADMFVAGGRTATFGVVNAPGFEVNAKTIVPMGGLVEGYIVRHDESFTINRSLSVGGYSPSVYYVYQPSALTVASVEELRRTGRPVDSYRLMTEEIEAGRDEVGVSLFCRGGAGLFVGSLLDVEEARALFDHKLDAYVNATINQVMGGYVSGIVCLLSGARGLLDPEDVPVDLVWRWGSMFWGPVVVMPFASPFASNRLEDMGLVIKRRYKQ